MPKSVQQTYFITDCVISYLLGIATREDQPYMVYALITMVF